MPASRLPTPPGSPSTSSRPRRVRSALPCSLVAGWSSASSPGSTAIVGWQRTSRQQSPQRRPPSMRHPSCCSPADWVVRIEIRVRLLLRQVLRELYAENDKLRLLIERLTRHQFGRRSEQLTAEQLQFGLEDQEQ